MRIRIRDTGQVMYENEYRREFAHLLPPPTLTEAWLNGAGADVVFEGPAATGGTVYQYSQYDGVEQKEDGNWYTKYILGPVFTDTTDEDGTVTTAADNQAAYEARMDADQAENQRAERDVASQRGRRRSNRLKSSDSYLLFYISTRCSFPSMLSRKLRSVAPPYVSCHSRRAPPRRARATRVQRPRV